MKRILVAVILEGGICLPSFCSALVQSVKVGLVNNLEFLPVFLDASGNWSMAFNHALTISYDEKLDGLVYISPRVSWKAESLIELVGRNKDAIGLPVTTRNGFDVKLGEISRLQDDGHDIKVQRASLDFFYLSSYAVERLSETHPLIDYNNSKVKLVIQSGDIYGAYFGPADILAHRLKEQGIETELNYRHTAFRTDSLEQVGSFEKVLEELRSQ